MDTELLENIGADINDAVTQSLKNLNSIWDDIGIFGEGKTDRLNVVKEHVKNMLDGMVSEEEGHRDAVVIKIENYLEETGELAKALNVKIPRNKTTHAPLYQVEASVREDLEKLRKIRDERLQKHAELAEKDEELRQTLGLRGRTPLPNPIPSQEQLDDLARSIEGMEADRVRFMHQYLDARAAIQRIMDELGLIPTLDFEKEVLCDDSRVKSFRPTQRNMNKLRDMHQCLEERLAEAKNLGTELREKLSNLWERLQVLPEYREDFLESHPGHSYDTLSALKEELKRCEELKRANIKVFVQQLREELASWWERCRFSSEQKAAFREFCSDLFTEELLELHEMEVAKLRKFYEDNRDIFEVVRQREKLWLKRAELETRSQDKTRLFKNRGGQLLREEKERKTIEKELPKIEKELMTLLTSYEENHGTPFLVDGECLLELIHDQWSTREENKEILKLKRKFTRDQQLEVESRMGSKPHTPGRRNQTPGSALTPGMASRILKDNTSRSVPTKTSLHSLKRKAADTPQTSVSKLNKRGKKSSEKKSPRSGSKSGPRSGPRSGRRYSSKIRRFGKGSPKVMNTTQEIHHPRTRRNIMAALPADGGINVSGLTSYTEFQRKRTIFHLEGMHNVRLEVCRCADVTAQREAVLKLSESPVPHLGSLVNSSAVDTSHFTGQYGDVCIDNQLELLSTEKVCRSSVVPQRCPREQNTPASTPARIASSRLAASSTAKLTLTPRHISSPAQLTLTQRGVTTVPITPLKPPRRVGPSGIPTPTTNPPVRRTSTRLNLRSPAYKSPAQSSSARLTTPRGRLPIYI